MKEKKPVASAANSIKDHKDKIKKHKGGDKDWLIMLGWTVIIIIILIKIVFKLALKIAFALSIAAIVFLVVWTSLKKPSHNRDWTIDHAVMPKIEFAQDKVTIYNIRDFSYAEDGARIPHYYDQTIDLDDVEGVDYMLSYFSENQGIAHALLTFRIKDEDNISISIEARREANESYSPFWGLFREFEEIYVIGSERDVIGLRTYVYKDPTYLFEGVTTPEKARALFVSMLERADHIYQNPEFYNTITNQCTNKLAAHIGSISEKEIPFSYKLYLPGYSDQLAYDLGFIKNDKSLMQVRAESLIDPNISLEDRNYSELIRK